MNINPQFLLDANGEINGVYLTLADWKTLSAIVPAQHDIPEWILKEHQERYIAIKSGAQNSIPADEVIKKLRDAFKEIQG